MLLPYLFGLFESCFLADKDGFQFVGLYDLGSEGIEEVESAEDVGDI